MSDCLYGWGDYLMRLDLEEKEEDLIVKLTYENHGDKYVVVKTKDGHVYEYGVYVNLKDCDWITYVRPPKLFQLEDERHIKSNEIYRKLQRVYGEYSRPKIEYSKGYAQFVFDDILALYEKTYRDNIRFNKDDDKEDLKRYLIANDIFTEENQKKLDSTHFNSRRNGIDGICGKTEINYPIIVDEVTEFIYNGEQIEPQMELCDTDEFGVDSWQIDLDDYK